MNKKLTDLNQIARETVDFYSRTMIDKGISPVLCLAPDLKKVMIDRSQIRQIIINLLLNATEAMSCDRHSFKKVITVSTELEHGATDRACIRISDTGGGIADRDCGDVFNPFFTTKPSGTGLGLSLCKKLALTHHGAITLDNKLGDGVTFTITLPCESAHEE